jgi:hypothetical protein
VAGVFEKQGVLAVTWDYKSFSCKTARAVKETMEKERVDGWFFVSVFKTDSGDFLLQMKKRKVEV